TTIAYQVGIAIERARLAEESARLARTEERARIARESHDTLAQGLTAIALHLEGALAPLERSPRRARERWERALAVSRRSLPEAWRGGRGADRAGAHRTPGAPDQSGRWAGVHPWDAVRGTWRSRAGPWRRDSGYA